MIINIRYFFCINVSTTIINPIMEIIHKNQSNKMNITQKASKKNIYFVSVLDFMIRIISNK